MTRFYILREDAAATAQYNGHFDATHKWRLPGVQCHTCGATWGSAGQQYPGVDLSQLPERTQLVSPWPVAVPEFERLRELVRPLAPSGVGLLPGAQFGPLEGPASGKFGPFTAEGDILWLVQRDALERLQVEGVKGLLGCRTELRFRKKDPPDILELQIEPHGRLHPDCLPPDMPPQCATCGRLGFSLPDEPILESASLPTDLNLFRVGDFATVVIGTERFKDAVHQLELPGITFREIPTR
ncbi:double-CXXCG motif protein [Pyxidicoccus trucidator]|uniref:SitI6 family double-CXXCG motif immunity protein n=1 Tax=Pyxidicoccus trucidator TaxID=2709662 RepID=UPI0013DBF85E|nr:double-CXXCG motif protein [Pyxidicoccus trucidator]